MPKSPTKAAPKKDNRVPVTQFRLTETTLAQLQRIADHYGLSSAADAVRIAATELDRAITREEIAKKS